MEESILGEPFIVKRSDVDAKIGALVLVRSLCIRRSQEHIKTAAEINLGERPADWNAWLARALEAQDIADSIEKILNAYGHALKKGQVDVRHQIMEVTVVRVDGTEETQLRPILEFVAHDPRGPNVIGAKLDNEDDLPGFYQPVPATDRNERVEWTLGGKCIVYVTETVSEYHEQAEPPKFFDWEGL